MMSKEIVVFGKNKGLTYAQLYEDSEYIDWFNKYFSRLLKRNKTPWDYVDFAEYITLRNIWRGK